MGREARELPLYERLLAGRLGPEAVALDAADEEERGQVEGADEEDVDDVEDAWGDDEFEGEEREKGDDVEGRRVGEDGVALHAFECQYSATELNLGRLFRDDLGKGIREHRHENRQKECVSEKRKANHQRRPKIRMKPHRLLNARPVKTEPDPEHPLADRLPVEVLGALGAVGANEPLEREEEPREQPASQERQDGEVLHHGVQGDEDDVVGHEVEGDAGEHDGCRDAEDGQAEAVVDLAGEEVEEARHEIDGEDGCKGDVEERPEILSMDFPAVLDDGGQLLQ